MPRKYSSTAARNKALAHAKKNRQKKRGAGFNNAIKDIKFAVKALRRELNPRNWSQKWKEYWRQKKTGIIPQELDYIKWGEQYGLVEKYKKWIKEGRPAIIQGETLPENFEQWKIWYQNNKLAADIKFAENVKRIRLKKFHQLPNPEGTPSDGWKYPKWKFGIKKPNGSTTRPSRLRRKKNRKRRSYHERKNTPAYAKRRAAEKLGRISNARRKFLKKRGYNV